MLYVCVIFFSNFHQMISTERVLTYAELNSETFESTQSAKPPLNWPTKGCIEIRDLTYRHSVDTPLVLHGINCAIEAGEKV